MSQVLKVAAVLCCLLPVLTIAIGVSVQPRSSDPITAAEIRRHRGAVAAGPPSAVVRAAQFGPLILAELGAIVLLVDAFRREYGHARGLPIALALIGAMTLGLTSVLYYAL